MTSTLFISDLHLRDDKPATVRVLQRFLCATAPAASALYILGDLFEYWLGDDDDAAVATTTATALAQLRAKGTCTYFVPGNRDLLLGANYARRAGLELLPDPYAFVLDGHKIVLSHGDALCTDDADYQRLRQQLHNPDFQQAFLARPLDERKQLVATWRQQSRESKQTKSAEIMDVNQEAVAALLRQYDYPTLIHGHTHLPAKHIHSLDAHKCVRWVLADWDQQAAYLAWDGQHWQQHLLTDGVSCTS